MFEFPPAYIPFKDKIYPISTLDDIMEFLYQYHYLRIHAQWNTWFIKSKREGDEYLKFLNEDSIKLFRQLLVLHMESAITLRLRLPSKSEWARWWFKELLEPYNERISLFKKSINTEDLFHDFDEKIKNKIYEQDVLFTDIVIHGYNFIYLFFRAVADEKWYIFQDTQEQKRLQKRIYNMIDKNPDFIGEISLFYNIEDYISKSYLDYPIIYELSKNRNLDVKDIIIKWKEIEIILYRFNNFPIPKEDIILHQETNPDSESPMNEDKELKECIFHEKSFELIYWNKKYKFRKDSMISKMVQLSFESDINDPIWYDNFYENYWDKSKNQKQQTIELSTTISKYNPIFEKKLGVKDFFWRGDGYYYRQY